MPDISDGDAVPEGALKEGSGFDLMEWFGRHGADRTRPIIDKTMAALESQGVTAFAATGYCWGALYTKDLVLEVRHLAPPRSLTSHRLTCAWSSWVGWRGG